MEKLATNLYINTTQKTVVIASGKPIRENKAVQLSFCLLRHRYASYHSVQYVTKNTMFIFAVVLSEAQCHQ